jgi:hypothetical protein
LLILIVFLKFLQLYLRYQILNVLFLNNLDFITFCLGHAVAYATSRKDAGSRPDEVNFSIYLILPVALGPGVYSASNRNEYQKHKNNNVSRE